MLGASTLLQGPQPCGPITLHSPQQIPTIWRFFFQNPVVTLNFLPMVLEVPRVSSTGNIVINRVIKFSFLGINLALFSAILEIYKGFLKSMQMTLWFLIYMSFSEFWLLILFQKHFWPPFFDAVKKGNLAMMVFAYPPWNFVKWSPCKTSYWFV